MQNLYANFVKNLGICKDSSIKLVKEVCHLDTKASNYSTIENILSEKVSFSDFISTFAMPLIEFSSLFFATQNINEFFDKATLEQLLCSKCL